MECFWFFSETFVESIQSRCIHLGRGWNERVHRGFCGDVCLLVVGVVRHPSDLIVSRFRADWRSHFPVGTTDCIGWQHIRIGPWSGHRANPWSRRWGIAVSDDTASHNIWIPLLVFITTKPHSLMYIRSKSSVTHIEPRAQGQTKSRLTLPGKKGLYRRSSH